MSLAARAEETGVDQTPLILVTFVHGTFDPAARWSRPGSPLVTNLIEAFGTNLLLTNFQWSGQNKQTDRRDAADELIKHIIRQSEIYPAARHFIIGHSHGGNIIRWAVDDISPRYIKQIVAIVTVSTPFLRFSRRNYFYGLHGVFWIWRTVLGFSLYLIWLSSLLDRSLFKEIENLSLLSADSPSWIVILIFLIAAPPVMIFLLMRMYILQRELELISYLRIEDGSAGREFFRPAYCVIPFLCLYDVIDEVNVLFSFANLVIIIFRVIDGLARVVKSLYTRWFEDLVKASKVAGFVFLGIIGVFILIHEWTGDPAISYLFYRYCVRLAILGFFISAGIPLVTYIGIMIYGTTEFTDLIVMDIRTSMLPIAVEYLKVKVSSPLDRGILSFGWVHTGILYKHKTASKIVEFMAELIK